MQPTRMRLLLPLLLLAPACPAVASETLSAVIAVTKDEAYRSSRVDWPRVEAEAAAVERAEGEDAAVQFVVRALGDRHTWYESPTASRPPAPAPTPSAAPTAPAAPQPIAVALPAAQGVPVLQINAWSGKDSTAAASSVRNALIASLEQPACGLVLDFSSNEGGNMWPMLVGLAPLLSEGRLGGFRSAKGDDTEIAYRGGKITLGGGEHFLNASMTLTPQRLPRYVAFVIGKETASSGEITSIMFRGQANVRYFGTPTAGYSTANATIPLPNGGRLMLTTAATLDRNGNAYETVLAPDVQTDHPIQDAATWVNSQCKKR
ncbi:hypothetical protein ASD69_00690 [Lysobacter sp. Root604]|nr:hypothetical protein ASD69_00690 [Lysobacter sp. Root604]